MTRWGLLLLATYIALGLSGLETRAAVRYAVWITAIVLVGVSVTNGAL